MIIIVKWSSYLYWDCRCSHIHCDHTGRLGSPKRTYNHHNHDQTGHTALQRAAAEGHVEIVKQLVKQGASVDHQDEVVSGLDDDDGDDDDDDDDDSDQKEKQ